MTASLALAIAATSAIGAYAPVRAATPAPDASSNLAVPSVNDVPKLDKSKAVTRKNATKAQLTAPKGQPNSNAITPLYSTCGGFCFRYAQVGQTVTNQGASYTIPVTRPVVDERDTRHTLFEMSIHGANGNYVEIGYTVDTDGVNGTDHVNPHLFGYYWVNGTGQGYNTNCTPVGSPTFTLGQDLSSHVGGAPLKFDIVHIGTAWWLKVNNSYVCAYDDSLWGGAFTGGEVVQIFTEVVGDNRNETESDAVGGVLASSTAGTPLTNYSLYSGGSAANLGLGVVSDPARWNAVRLSATTANFGGPGGHPDVLACSGVGAAGYGQWCWYSNTSGGVPINQQATTDATVPRNVCITNQGASDPGGHTIRTVVNTAYVQMRVYNTANCTGTPTTITNYGQTNLPAGYAAAAHMSFMRLSTPLACAAGTSQPTC